MMPVSRRQHQQSVHRSAANGSDFGRPRFSPMPNAMHFDPGYNVDYSVHGFQSFDDSNRDHIAPSPLTICSEVSEFTNNPSSLQQAAAKIYKPTPRHLSKTSTNAPTNSYAASGSTPLRQHHHHLNKNAVPFEFAPIGSLDHNQGPHRCNGSKHCGIGNGNGSNYQYHTPSRFGKTSPAPTVDTAWETVDGSCYSSASSTSERYKNSSHASRASPVSWRRGGGTPTPEVVEEVRQTRIKTELCMHYVNNRPCPFGAQCTYAHGEEELQLTRLLDWHEAGLVDVATYRTKPCLTWVMTGSCPFGKRCTGIHDPRVAGSQPSWLPHTETQGNSMATDINVEALHQKNLHSILYGTPFGEQFDLENCHSSSWNDLYRLVCHMDVTKQSGWKERRSNHRYGSNNRRSRDTFPKKIDPATKLEIALLMRGEDFYWQYKYRPGHVIFDELCMVLQQKTFKIEPNGKIVEITRAVSSHQSKNGSDNVITVHEIAFGPDADPSVRGVGLYFQIQESNIQLCTPQQAKRFRWKRGLVKSGNTNNKDNSSDLSNSQRQHPASVFDLLDNFLMIRPHDPEAYQLTTDMMQHRLETLKAESIEEMEKRFRLLQDLKSRKLALQSRFNDTKKAWIRWAWPVNAGREIVDKFTPVPSIDTEYKIPTYDSIADIEDDDERLYMGKCVETLWSSFVTYTSESSDQDDDSLSDIMSHSDVNESGCRLRIFEDLSDGIEIAVNRALPLLPSMKSDIPLLENLRDSERCWRSLLLPSDSLDNTNEWDLVQDHFNKSRSKKVLDIIQKRE